MVFCLRTTDCYKQPCSWAGRSHGGHSSSIGSRTCSRNPVRLLAGHQQLQKRAVQFNLSTFAVHASMQSGMQGQVDSDYLKAAGYLAEIGFTNKTEIARVLDIAMNPSSLFVQASVNVNARPLTVDADIRPIVEYLLTHGVAAGDVVKVISSHPPVLSYSIEGRLEPFWEYLTSIGVHDVAAAVVKRPSLLGLSVDSSLKKIVEYLQYIETPAEKIVDYICNSI